MGTKLKIAERIEVTHLDTLVPQFFANIRPGRLKLEDLLKSSSGFLRLYYVDARKTKEVTSYLKECTWGTLKTASSEKASISFH